MFLHSLAFGTKSSDTVEMLQPRGRVAIVMQIAQLNQWNIDCLRPPGQGAIIAPRATRMSEEVTLQCNVYPLSKEGRDVVA